MLNKGSKKLSKQNIGGILMNAADESTNLYPFYIDYLIFFPVDHESKHQL